MNIQVILEVIIAIGILLVAVIEGIPFLKKHGVSDDQIKTVINDAKQIENVIDVGLNVADKMAPNSKIVDTLQFVEGLAKKFTNHAEELYLSGQLPADQRNEIVKSDVEKILNFAGVQVTDEVQKFIDATINETCLILPHKDEQTKAVVTNLTNANAQLEAQLNAQQGQVQQLQAQVDSQSQLAIQIQNLQTENEVLKNKLSTIQSAIQS